MSHLKQIFKISPLLFIKQLHAFKKLHPQKFQERSTLLGQDPPQYKITFTERKRDTWFS